MKGRTLLLGVLAFIVFGVVIYIMKDVEPFKTIYLYIQPYAQQLIQILKDNILTVLGGLGSISAAIIGILQRKATATKQSLIAAATDHISNLEGQVNNISQQAEEKIKEMTGQVTSLTEQRDDLQTSLIETTADLKETSTNLTETQTLLATANKRIEDLTKENEFLRKAAEFLKSNEADAYVTRP